MKISERQLKEITDAIHEAPHLTKYIKQDVVKRFGKDALEQVKERIEKERFRK